MMKRPRGTTSLEFRGMRGRTGMFNSDDTENSGVKEPGGDVA